MQPYSAMFRNTLAINFPLTIHFSLKLLKHRNRWGRYLFQKMVAKTHLTLLMIAA